LGGLVEIGGDSGAVRQVSDISRRFGRRLSTGADTWLSRKAVKGENFLRRLHPDPATRQRGERESGRIVTLFRSSRPSERREAPGARAGIRSLKTEEYGSRLLSSLRSDGGRQFSRLLQHQIELENLVIGHGGMLNPVAGGLSIPAHGIEAVADHAGG